ncbi:unnamed protein product, partial [Didymodactylos carnosus]
MIMSHFEQLSDEVLVNICSYLKFVDILYAFDGLNERFRIITQLKSHIEIDLSGVSFKQYEFICDYFLFDKILSNKVYSLTLSNKYAPRQITLFNKQFVIYQIFPNLKCLKLIDFDESSTKILSTLRYFKHLSEFYLTINNDWTSTFDYYSRIFAQQHLLNKISFNIQNGIELTKTTHDIKPCYTIKKVKISLKTMSDLLKLFEITPNIYDLNVHIHSYDNNEWQQSLKRINIIQNLVYFNFKIYQYNGIKFEDFSNLLRKFTSLKILTIDIYTNDITYLNGCEWEYLGKLFMPKLKKFFFSIRLQILNTLIPDINSILSSFHSDYWHNLNINISHYYDIIDSMKLFILHTIPYKNQTFQISLTQSITNIYSTVKTLSLYVPSAGV